MVYDIVGLYLDPPESAVVLSVDEKSQVQALSRSQPAFPMMPGMPEKRTHGACQSFCVSGLDSCLLFVVCWLEVGVDSFGVG